MVDRLNSAFLFTDIEGSTRLWEVEPERMASRVEAHERIVFAAVETHGGEVLKRLWRNARNITKNSAIGSAIHIVGTPIRALRRAS